MNAPPKSFSAYARRCQLGEVLEFRNEIVHPKDNPKGEAVFVGLEHIESNTGVRTGSAQIKLSELTGRRARFRSGDIVYGYLRPYLNKVWIAELDGLCSVDQYVFKVKPAFDRNYVAHFLRSSEFLKTAPIDSTPGQLPRIRSGEISETLMPTPTLDEQRRIAAILDKADALRRKRKRALELLDGLMQAIVRETFGRSNTTALLGEVCDVQGGLQLSRVRAKYPIEAPYLRVANVYRSRLDLSEVKKFRVQRTELDRTILKRGDILFVEGHGNPDEVGRSAVWDGSIDRCTHQNHLIRARPKSEAIDSLLLCHWLNAPDGRRHLLRRATTTSGLNTINISDVKYIPIPLLEKTHIDVARGRVERAQRLHRLCLAQTGFWDTLFASLQHRAFTGQL